MFKIIKIALELAVGFVILLSAQIWIIIVVSSVARML